MAEDHSNNHQLHPMQAEDQPADTKECPVQAFVNAERISSKLAEEYQSQSIKIPAYATAVKRHSASFFQLAGSIFYSRDSFTKSSDQREICEGFIEPLTEAFEAAHGAITREFYCQNVMAAAVLTARQEIWVITPPLDAHIVPIAEMIYECLRLDAEADRVLGSPERLRDLQATKTLIYGAIEGLLSCIDDNVNQSPPSVVVNLQLREVSRAQQYYQRAASLYAQFDYFIGMLIGAAITLLITFVASEVILFRPAFSEEGPILAGCLTAGGVGAILSVMSRMTFGGLSLDYEASRRILKMLGAFRPVIGMALGAAMWVLSGSGILIVVPSDPSKASFFRVLTAFLAGFSERWAQDMLGRTAERIPGHGAAASGSKRDSEHPRAKRKPNSKGRR